MMPAVTVPPEAERVADRHHPIADLGFVAVAPGHEGQLVLGVDLEQREIGLFVAPDDLGRRRLVRRMTVIFSEFPTTWLLVTT
jgi:hypothetical protein